MTGLDDLDRNRNGRWPAAPTGAEFGEAELESVSRPAQRRADLERQIGEVDFWDRLGVTVLHGRSGRKGPWPKAWPSLSAEDACAQARSAASKRPVNLAVRLGLTTHGLFLAHLDFDGKCSCGCDLSDHEGGTDSCRSRRKKHPPFSCPAFSGVPPEIGLKAAMAILPPNVCVIETGRGFRVLFFSVSEIPETKLPEFGAEVAATCRKHPPGSPRRGRTKIRR